MQVATIKVDKQQAIAAYREYRQAVAANPNKEDRICMMGYRALSQGKAIIDVREAIRAAGLDENGCPRLCIGRADWRGVDLAWSTGTVRFNPLPRSWDREIEFPNLFPGQDIGKAKNRRGSYAWCSQTPFIPPRIRPSGDLHDYFILWEAAWEQVTRDPYLLKRLGGNLYVVLAAWDLTELERAVIAARPQ